MLCILLQSLFPTFITYYISVMIYRNSTLLLCPVLVGRNATVHHYFYIYIIWSEQICSNAVILNEIIIAVTISFIYSTSILKSSCLSMTFEFYQQHILHYRPFTACTGVMVTCFTVMKNTPCICLTKVK